MTIREKLKDLADKAGRWLGLGSLPPAPTHTGAVVTDRFDVMAWRDLLSQAAALRNLVDDLSQHHDHAADLLQDVWSAAYKAIPHLRELDEMEPGHAINHQVLITLLTTPEWQEVRRETIGDPYAAAMAVLSQEPELRRLLEDTEDAQRAATIAAAARQRAEQQTGDLVAALQAAQDADAPDGEAQNGGIPTGGGAAGGADSAGIDATPGEAGDAEVGTEADTEADTEVEAEIDETVGDQTAEDQERRRAAVLAAVERALAAAQAATDEADRAQAEADEALHAASPAIRVTARAAAAHAAENLQEEATLMAAFGVGPGQVEKMDFATRRLLAERLAGGRLGKFAKLIGRFRQMATGERARRTEHAVGELVGITLGDDLGRVIPSEIASLGVPALRAVFAAKLAEGRLMVYDTRGDAPAGQGAIIACVDCSGSMTLGHGGTTREAWAKALTLALLDQAQASRRAFAAILFSDRNMPTPTFHFPAETRPAIEEVVKMTEYITHAGTDFARPLEAAADLLEEQFNDDGRQKGDIVFITDGSADVREDWMRLWQERKTLLGFRVFGVAIAQRPSTVLEALSDNVREVTDLADVDVASDMFRVI